MIHQDYIVVVVYSALIYISMQFMWDQNLLLSLLGWMGFAVNYTSFINYAHSRRDYERTH